MCPEGFVHVLTHRALGSEQEVEPRFSDSLHSPLSSIRYFNSVVPNIVFSITMDPNPVLLLFPPTDS